MRQTAPVGSSAFWRRSPPAAAWYDDIFDLHRIAVGSDGALWWAEGAPPRWHSAVKTLVPTTDPSGALLRMERHPHGTIADSFGLLDLAAQRFDLLFAATWLHHRGVASAALTPGWIRVPDPDLMARWNLHHDTVGVLPPDLWAHPRFTVLARRDGDDLTGGRSCTTQGRSRTLEHLVLRGPPVDPRVLLEIAAETHPGRAVVDYAWGPDLETMLGAGSSRWVRTTSGFGSGAAPDGLSA